MLVYSSKYISLFIVFLKSIENVSHTNETDWTLQTTCSSTTPIRCSYLCLHAYKQALVSTWQNLDIELSKLRLRATPAKRLIPPKAGRSAPYPGLEVSYHRAQIKEWGPSCSCVRYGRQCSFQTEIGATAKNPRGQRHRNGNWGC